MFLDWENDILDTICDRMMLIIKEKTSDRRRWKELEEISGITAKTWQNFGRSKQRATAEMVEAISKEWPEYAFWLTTGLSDPSYGHVGPTEKCGYPKHGSALETTNRYFRTALEARELARKSVMAWWQEELGEDLSGLTASQLINDQLLRNARNILQGDPNKKNLEEITVFDAAIRKMSLSESLRKAELLLEKERELDYVETEDLIIKAETIISVISDAARIDKIHVNYDFINDKLSKLKKMVARHNRFNNFVDDLKEKSSSNKEN